MGKQPEEPRVRVVSRRDRTLRLRFDYGKEISVTFPPDRTPEEIEEEMKELYELHRQKRAIQAPETLDW